jgi:hypothetical protein
MILLWGTIFGGNSQTPLVSQVMVTRASVIERFNVTSTGLGPLSSLYTPCRPVYLLLPLVSHPNVPILLTALGGHAQKRGQIELG